MLGVPIPSSVVIILFGGALALCFAASLGAMAKRDLLNKDGVSWIIMELGRAALVALGLLFLTQSITSMVLIYVAYLNKLAGG